MKIRDIVESSLKEIIREQERRRSREYKYGNAEEMLQERNRRKISHGSEKRITKKKRRNRSKREKKQKERGANGEKLTKKEKKYRTA